EDIVFPVPFIFQTEDSIRDDTVTGVQTCALPICISEELINALSKLPQLQVVARPSSFAFKGKNEDMRQIGQALQVATVLGGSVRRAANRLRVTAQLTDARNGYNLWSETYDREMGDVFAVEDEISHAIM